MPTGRYGRAPPACVQKRSRWLNPARYGDLLAPGRKACRRASPSFPEPQAPRRGCPDNAGLCLVRVGFLAVRPCPFLALLFSPARLTCRPSPPVSPQHCRGVRRLDGHLERNPTCPPCRLRLAGERRAKATGRKMKTKEQGQGKDHMKANTTRTRHGREAQGLSACRLSKAQLRQLRSFRPAYRRKIEAITARVCAEFRGTVTAVVL